MVSHHHWSKYDTDGTFQPFSGALVEFFNKKKSIIYCDFGRGLIVFFTAVLYMCGVIKPWNLLVLTFLNSTLEAVRLPNGPAILLDILQKENYKPAVAFNQGISRTAEVIGLGLAASIIGILDIGGAICLDAVTFILSGIMFTFIKTKETAKAKASFKITEYFQSMKDGGQYFFHNNISVMVCFVCIVLNITAIPVINLQIAFVSEYLKLGLLSVSMGSTFTTAGAILGSFLLPKITEKINETSILIWGGSAIGFIYFVFILIGTVPSYHGKFGFYLLTAFLFGVVNSLIGVAVQVIFISHIPKDFIGRVGGIFNSLACSSIPVGSFILAGIGTRLSIKEIYILTGSITILVFWRLGRMKAVKDLA